MGLYTGFDLHSSNTYVGIIDGDGKRIWKKKLRNDPSLILATVYSALITSTETVLVSR